MAKILNLNNNDIRFTPSACMRNDLSYFLSTLAEINEVISQTYGPEAGYVAQHDLSSDDNTFEYTKDGLTTLNNLRFSDPTDNLVLNMVKSLAFKIKQTSGDGSTTATKLLYYMVKHAFEAIRGEYKDIEKDIRIRTPKAMEYVVKQFLHEIKSFTKKDVTLEDLRYAAYIALNSDDTLLEPIDKILEHLKQTNAPIDSSLKIEALKSHNEETSVMHNPGYILGTSEFAIDSNVKELDNVKIILMPCNISYGMVYNIVSDMIKTLRSLEGTMKVIFLINYIEDDATRNELKALLREAQARNTELTFDFIELSASFRTTDHRLIDIAYLLNTSVVDLNSCIELRDDDENTKYIYKWVAKPEDPKWGYKTFANALFKELRDGYTANIKTLPSLGFTVSLAPIAIEQQRTPEYKQIFDKHVEGLREATKINDQSIANDAKARLFYLQDNYHIVTIAKRVGDHNRIYTAYKDAVKAMTSVASYGYYMGGSIGAYTTTLYMQNNNPESLADEKLQRTIYFLQDLLIEALSSVIKDLKLDFNKYSMVDLFKERIDFQNNKIDGQVVIMPVETDRVMIPTVLYLFSNIFSSLMVEFNTFDDASRFKYITHVVSDKVDAILNPVIHDEDAYFEETEEPEVEENLLPLEDPEEDGIEAEGEYLTYDDETQDEEEYLEEDEEEENGEEGAFMGTTPVNITISDGENEYDDAEYTDETVDNSNSLYDSNLSDEVDRGGLEEVEEDDEYDWLSDSDQKEYLGDTPYSDNDEEDDQSDDDPDEEDDWDEDIDYSEPDIDSEDEWVPGEIKDDYWSDTEDEEDIEMEAEAPEEYAESFKEAPTNVVMKPVVEETEEPEVEDDIFDQVTFITDKDELRRIHSENKMKDIENTVKQNVILDDDDEETTHRKLEEIVDAMAKKNEDEEVRKAINLFMGPTFEDSGWTDKSKK